MRGHAKTLRMLAGVCAILAGGLAQVQAADAQATRPQPSGPPVVRPGSVEAKAIHPVSPFPKYMLVAVLYGTELERSPEQDKALEAWRHEHMGRWSGQGRQFSWLVRAGQNIRHS